MTKMPYGVDKASLALGMWRAFKSEALIASTVVLRAPTAAGKPHTHTLFDEPKVQ